MNKIYVLLLGSLYFFSTPLSSQAPTASFAIWKDNKKAAYTIIHDDYSNYVTGIFRDAYPIAKARGVKICFGAITGFCGETEWANARTMIADGHECVNHSHNHKCGGSAGQCTGLSTYSSADFNTELNQSTSLIESNTGQRPLFFIHPYDASSDAVLNHLKGNLGYLGSRAGSQGAINPSNFTDFMRENYFVYDGSAAALNSLNTAVNSAIAAGGYAVREFHGIDDGSWAAMTKANYTSHLDYVKSKIEDGSLWSCTASEAITYKMQRDAWSINTAFNATDKSISVIFNSITTINTSVLKTPVTVNVNLGGLPDTYDVYQNGAIIGSVKKGDIISFNIYPHKGAVTLKCTSCAVVTPNLPAEIRNLLATAQTNAVNLSWTNPTNNFEEVMIVAKASSGFTGIPNGTSYTADANFTGFGSGFDGGKVVYRGTGSSTTVSNLTGGTLYYFKAFTRLGTQWSNGVQVSATPNAVVIPPIIGAFDSTKCYKIEARHSKKVMELTSRSRSNNIVIQQDAWTGSRAQIWRIKNSNDNHYQISNGYSGKFVTVVNASTSDGAKIIQLSNTNTDNQRFQFTKNTEGYYVVTAKHSGKALDVVQSSLANGADIIQWRQHRGLNQQWLISEVGCPSNTQALEDSREITLDGRRENNGVVLNWVVNSEDLIDYYEIEKADENGDFKQIKIINGESRDEVRAFTYTDENPNEGDNYYRVKTLLPDGTPQLSKTLKVNFGKRELYIMYPNPTDGDFNIDLSSDEGKPVDITFYTALGKVVLSEHVDSATKNPLNINLNTLDAGQFFVKIQAQDKKVVLKKLVIMR